MVSKPKRKKIVSHLAKLTPRQVRYIRNAVSEGVRYIDLATTFRVSTATICQIIRGKIYRKVA